MAFPSASGHGNLPNGNFSPVIYSKQVQLAFRKASTVEDITNNDYFGEIANMGDSVKIIKEPEVSVQSYARGTQITAQDLNDEHPAQLAAIKLCMDRMLPVSMFEKEGKTRSAVTINITGIGEISHTPETIDAEDIEAKNE